MNDLYWPKGYTSSVFLPQNKKNVNSCRFVLIRACASTGKKEGGKSVGGDRLVAANRRRGEAVDAINVYIRRDEVNTLRQKALTLNHSRSYLIFSTELVPFTTYCRSSRRRHIKHNALVYRYIAIAQGANKRGCSEYWTVCRRRLIRRCEHAERL